MYLKRALSVAKLFALAFKIIISDTSVTSKTNKWFASPLQHSSLFSYPVLCVHVCIFCMENDGHLNVITTHKIISWRIALVFRCTRVQVFDVFSSSTASWSVWIAKWKRMNRKKVGPFSLMRSQVWMKKWRKWKSLEATEIICSKWIESV